MKAVDNLDYFRQFGIEARQRIIQDCLQKLSNVEKKVKESTDFESFLDACKNLETLLKNLATHMTNEEWHAFVNREKLAMV